MTTTRAVINKLSCFLLIFPFLLMLFLFFSERSEKVFLNSTEIDLGEILCKDGDGVGCGWVDVINNSKEVLYLKDVSASCGCISFFEFPREIKPLSRGKLMFEMNVKASDIHGGSVNVFISVDHPEVEQLAFMVKGRSGMGAFSVPRKIILSGSIDNEMIEKSVFFNSYSFVENVNVVSCEFDGGTFSAAVPKNVIRRRISLSDGKHCSFYSFELELGFVVERRESLNDEWSGSFKVLLSNGDSIAVPLVLEN